jgi:hypothetical protein
MTIDFGVRITNGNGDPVKGAEVLVQYPWATDSGITDEDGWVRFERSHAFGDAVQTSIYVNGDLRADNIWIQSNSTFTYSV